MTDEIRKAAEALIKDTESGRFYDVALSSMQSYKELKASLRPSREELADYLEQYVKGHTEKCRIMIAHTIEELRK